MCANNEMYSIFTKKIVFKSHFICSNEKQVLVFNSMYTHLFHHFFCYLLNQHSAFPSHYYTSYYFLLCFFFYTTDFFVQRTSGSILFFIQIYDIIIFWSITHYKRTMYVSSPSVLGEPGGGGLAL